MPGTTALSPTSSWLESLVCRLVQGVSLRLAVRGCAIAVDRVDEMSLHPALVTQTQTEAPRSCRLLPTLSGSCNSGNNALYSDGPLLFPNLLPCWATFNLNYPCSVSICLRVKEAWKVLDLSLALSFRPTKPEKPSCYCMLPRLWGNCIIFYSLKLILRCVVLKAAVPPTVVCGTVIYPAGVFPGYIQPKLRGDLVHTDASFLQASWSGNAKEFQPNTGLGSRLPHIWLPRRVHFLVSEGKDHTCTGPFCNPRT